MKMKQKRKKDDPAGLQDLFTSGTTEALLDIDRALSNIRRKIREA